MKRKITLLIISILILTLSILGLTYAFMKPKIEETENKSNITLNACAKIQLKDNNSDSINLENTYPMDDEMGLKTKPYEFTITSTCDNYVGFNLYLTSLTTNEIEDNNIHFAITDMENSIITTNVLNKTTSGVRDFNSNELSELDKGIKGTHKNIYKVYSENIALKGTNNYRLYLWIDKDASNDTMGKSFKVGLSVKSYNREETLAEYLIKNKNETLIYHDGLCDYTGEENCDLEAGDLNYRFSGAKANVNNYVCLDNKEVGNCDNEDLYRIIGLFKNNENKYEMKLIKYNYATSEQLGSTGAYYGSSNYYYWNRSNGTSSRNVNMWAESNLNKVNLNTFYYNYITTRASYLQGHITEHTWTTGGYENDGNAKATYDAELGENKVKVGESVCYTQGNTSTTRACIQEDIEYKDEIGLMYVSDYMYGASPAFWSTTAYNYSAVTSNNWLYSRMTEWFISRASYRGDYAWYVYSLGYVHSNSYSIVDNSSINIEVRPVFYLDSSAKIKEGEGSKTKPYRITFE